MPEYLFLLYAGAACHLQPCCRKGNDGTARSVQVRLHGHRQNGQAGGTFESHPPNPGYGLGAVPGDGFRPRHFHVLILHPGNVVHRHGLSEEERPAKRHTLLSQAENGTAIVRQMGKTHAGNCRQIRYGQHSLSAAGD